MLYTKQYLYKGYTLSHCKEGVVVTLQGVNLLTCVGGWLDAETAVDSKILSEYAEV